MTESMDRRKRIIAIVAHCILNQNTVVKPLASHGGAVGELVKKLVDYGYGLIQLPCPEAIYLGLKRWWHSREQLDVELYKSSMSKILESHVMLLRELARDGCRYVLIGIHGSPSCAAVKTTSNRSWEGEPRIDKYPASVKIDQPGVFIEVLYELIDRYGLPRPLLSIDIDHGEIATRGLPREIDEKLRNIAETYTQ